MHRLTILLFLFLLTAPTVFAQEDTIRVTTLTFDSITTRRGWWIFPDDSHTFRKVLMHHTLKCSPLTTQDQYACGEWDYLTYTFVHDHTGQLDSTAYTHPWFRIGMDAPPVVTYTDQPISDQYQLLLNGVSLVSTESEELFPLGTGGALDELLFQGSGGVTRSQYLYTVDELQAAGLQTGPVQQLRLTTVGTGPEVQRLVIRMKGIAGELEAMVHDGLITVFDGVPEDLASNPGEHLFQLTTPFQWDGSSGILVDFAAETGGGPGDLGVVSSPASAGTALHDGEADGYLALMNDNIAVSPTPFSELQDQITITFRVRGDAIIPLNTSLLEASNAQNRRVLNIHLPWSNNRVYWDAGIEGTTYDRIDKLATTQEVEGQWNHWAFVKNTTAGTMKIYLNGVLWHSGTGKTKPLAGITKFRIGSSHDGTNPFPGHLDELNIFAAELDAATIAAWQARKVDGTHPAYSSLLYSFHFDEPVGDHAVINSADPAHGGTLMGSVQRLRHPATEIGGSAIPGALRADLVLGQGTYGTVPVQQTYTYAVPHPGLTLVYFEVQGQAAAPVDTVHGWLGGWSYTYGPNGIPIDSMEVDAITVVNDTLDYFGIPFEVIHNYEIGRYITPYGIGLNLGTNGFRWTYDVTDYQWLLRDSVDLSAGNQQELIDVTFEMIEGTPPREVVQLQRPWGPQRSYSYSALSNDTGLPPVTVDLHPSAASRTLRTRLTGHGHASNTGNYPHCCEWKDNTHYVTLNGQPLDEWHIWQTNDCALNPVYPQGGTWLNAREGWCPGDVVKDHEVMLPAITGDQVTLDYAITPVPVNNLGMGAGNYVVNMDLFEFADAPYQTDAEIYEVKRPSKADYFRRDNPICYDPLIVLRNVGTTPLTSVTFSYGVSGGVALEHTWTGDLGAMQHTEVLLPVPDGAFWYGDEARRFTATILAANGSPDPHPANDSYSTAFELPVVYVENFILDYRTNNRPWENSVTIRDVHGNIKFERMMHTANTVYRDTMALYNGCYTLEMLDTGNDGLSYWADSNQGTGFCRLRRMNNTVMKTFAPEFGRKIHWPFVIGDLVGMPELPDPLSVQAYPNPSDGRFTIELAGLTGNAQMTVFDTGGRLVQHEQINLSGADRSTLDISGLANGLYVLRVTAAEHTAIVRLSKQ